MKKRIILCLFVCISYAVVGCGQNTAENTGSVTETVGMVEKGQADIVKEEEEDIKVIITEEEKTELDVEPEEKGGEEEEESKVTDEQLELMANPYFPAKEHMALKVRANYYKGQEPIDEIVDAEIDRIKVYEEGCIYKLEIHITTDTASVDFPVMVRYFYVKADEINLIWPFYQAEPNDKCIYFPDDDELLLQTFDTEEKLESKGQLEPVCREENIEEEEEYWFCSMKKEEERVTFYRSEMNHSGDEMQKDLFVWEKGKGLVKFETGFGPGPMEVSINEICEVTDEEYGGKCLEQLWQECDLPLEECPDYDYLASEGHYYLSLVNGAAYVVKEYAMDSGLENEVWELRRIYSCGDTRAFLAYVESETEDELYILFADGPGALPVYIILADIRKDADADVSLPYGRYAYNSMLEWYSYQDWFDGEADGQHVHHETIGEIHDSIYDSGFSYTIDDYVDRTGGDAESQWEVCGNDVYVGKNGCIACAVCQNESRYFIVLWDVNNKMYAVVEL